MSLALNALMAVALQGAPPVEAPPAVEMDAEATAVQLVWDAPEGCSDAATMQGRLDEAMGVEVDEGTTRRRWVIARVRQDEGAWNLRLWVAPEGGLSERALSETSCAELERATLTIVAMLMPTVMIEPAAGPPPKPGDMEPKSDPQTLDEQGLEALIGDAPPDEPVAPDDGAPDMAAPAPSKIRGAIGFSGGYASGTMPEGAGGFMVTSAMLFPGARLELVGSYWGTRDIGLGTAPGARARYNLLSAAVRGCGAPEVNAVIEVPLCGSLEAGSVLANVDGASLLHGPGKPVVLLGVTSGVHFVVAPTVALKLGLEGWVALVQAQHRALEGLLSRSGRFGYRLTAGIEFRFGSRRRSSALARSRKESP